MSHDVNIDIETRSDVKLSDCGVYKYSESEAFRILLFAYAFDFGEVHVIDLTKQDLPAEIVSMLTDPDYIKHAYNAEFEIVCLERMLGTEFDYSQWRDTMLDAVYHGFPASLKMAGGAILAEDERKDSAGTALIKKFCLPHTPSKKDPREWIEPAEEPEDWERFIQYNRQDVVTEMNICRRFIYWPVPDDVQKQWQHTVRMNHRGVALDIDFMESAIAAGEASQGPLLDEAREITGCRNPNSVAQLKKWLSGKGIEASSLSKDYVEKLLQSDDLDPDVRRVLKIRLETSASSTKKYNRMKTIACSDGRAHGIISFYGAGRTGRYAGRLIQPQNMPRTYLHGPDLDTARELIRQRDTDSISLLYGSVSDTLRQCVRTALVPSPGHKFIDADFSSIEARVVAWLAGENWALKAFRNGEDIYCATASQMFHVPVVKHGINGELRQKGKIATLALGYGGGTSAMIRMGALDMGLKESELQPIVDQWRKTNRNIVALWRDLDSAILRVVRHRKDKVHAVKVGKIRIYWIVLPTATEYDSAMVVKLPTGRELFYVSPEITTNRFGSDSISYMAQNQTTKKWDRLETYGGKITENIVQAIARDVLVEKMIDLEDAGYDVVFHIHDEVVIDAKPQERLVDVCQIMRQPVSWAEDLPLDADGWEGAYFTKD